MRTVERQGNVSPAKTTITAFLITIKWRILSKVHETYGSNQLILSMSVSGSRKPLLDFIESHTILPLNTPSFSCTRGKNNYKIVMNI